MRKTPQGRVGSGATPSGTTALELFSGIGAFAMVADMRGIEIHAAVDQNPIANEVYELNVGRAPRPQLLESITDLPPAELWWLSPPCTPFTVRGRKRDDEDPRARALLHLIELIERGKGPEKMLIENVPGFAGSRVHERLLAALTSAGLGVVEVELCPTEFGVPMRRRRHFILASQREVVEVVSPAEKVAVPLSQFLLAEPSDELLLDAETVAAYEGVLDIVDPGEDGAIVACVTRAYGSSPLRSGSYVRRPDGRLRRLAPTELLRLFGFPESFRFPPSLSLRDQWKLVGNSVDLRAVELLLDAIR